MFQFLVIIVCFVFSTAHGSRASWWFARDHKDDLLEREYAQRNGWRHEGASWAWLALAILAEIYL